MNEAERRRAEVWALETIRMFVSGQKDLKPTVSALIRSGHLSQAALDLIADALDGKTRVRLEAVGARGAPPKDLSGEATNLDIGFEAHRLIEVEDVKPEAVFSEVAEKFATSETHVRNCLEQWRALDEDPRQQYRAMKLGLAPKGA